MKRVSVLLIMLCAFCCSPAEDVRGAERVAPWTLADEQRQISLKPRPGWQKYFMTPGATLKGRSTAEVRTLLGEPPFLVRSTAAMPEFSREVWVYLPHNDDPTGIYIYFKGGKVVKTRKDEFNGFVGSSIWDDHDFWSR